MKKNYLIYSLVTEWAEPPRARQQVSYELAADGMVYFSEKNKWGFPRINYSPAQENIIVITPYYWLPCKFRYRIPFINNRYHKWLLGEIKKLNIEFDIVVNFDYTAKDFGIYFHKYVFYCADDNVGFGNFNFGPINHYHEKTEKETAKNASICIVTSAYMLTKIKKYNPATYEVALGAPKVAETPPIFIASKNKMPVLGLVGYLDSNIDYVLLNKLLQRYMIIFIGPINKNNYKLLSNTDNAVFKGSVTGAELYSELQEVDVCIAPYDVLKLNKGATSNKLWLYLSVGKPAVITSMPNIENLEFEKDTVYICSNEHFEEACIKAFENNTAQLQEKRYRLAKSNSWRNKVEDIKSLFFRNVTGKKCLTPKL